MCRPTRVEAPVGPIGVNPAVAGRGPSARIDAVRPLLVVNLRTRRWSPDQVEVARALVRAWLEETHPFDSRRAGQSVRLQEDDPDRWWRLVIDEGLSEGAVATTTVTIAVDEASNETALEVRVVLVPGGRRITTAKHVVDTSSTLALVGRLLDAVVIRDAGTRVVARPQFIADTDGAQAVAAFCMAPGRALPVLVETVPGREQPVFDADRLARELAGHAHVVRLTGEAARASFHALIHESMLPAKGLALFWPGRNEVKVLSAAQLGASGAESAARGLLQMVNDAARDSLAPLRPPRFNPSRSKEALVSDAVEVSPARASSGSPDTSGSASEGAVAGGTTSSPVDPAPAERMVSWAEYRVALDGWQEAYNRIDEIEQALAEADRTIEEKNLILANREGLVDQLVLQNSEFAIRLGQSPQGLRASSASDAVRQAEELCTNLTFVARARETAAELQGVDANRLLEDLLRLNVVAGDWKSGRINKASLTISCRSLGLNYAAGISDTAENKFAEDYAFPWRGRTEYAVAHIRHGRGTRLYRVHLHFDDEAQQVVVAYVGRHLRDAGSN